jgi:hypothetical protein
MRLVELQQEIDSLHAAFPTLNGMTPVKRRGRPRKETAEISSKRKGWSAAARRAVGERMKAYWLKRKATASTSEAAPAAVESEAPAQQVAKPAAKRTLSAEGRARIAAAQKKRWAKAKRGKKR